MEVSDIIKCPVCDNELFLEEKLCRCKNNHSYDVSKTNYVNLILANQKKSTFSGDTSQSVYARDKFLARGHYKRLSDCINRHTMNAVESSDSTPFCILDMGCGVGYYVDMLHQEIEYGGLSATIYGMDISKKAVKCAASKNKHILFIVGNSFRIPLMPKSVDCILNVFAPFSADEVNRILKTNGVVVSVKPGIRHLIELKNILYNSPRCHDATETYHELNLIDKCQIEYSINVNEEDVSNLYFMTPYSWTTQKNPSKEELACLTHITASFVVCVYQKP